MLTFYESHERLHLVKDFKLKKSASKNTLAIHQQDPNSVLLQYVHMKLYICMPGGVRNATIRLPYFKLYKAMNFTSS